MLKKQYDQPQQSKQQIFFPLVTEEKEEGWFLLQMHSFTSAGVLT